MKVPRVGSRHGAFFAFMSPSQCIIAIMSNTDFSRKTANPPVRGRPREFDVDAICEVVAQVFWARGYRGTSLDEICKATGLMRGSLYGAFGDKHGMLLAAIEHYSDGSIAQLAARLNSSEPADQSLRAALMHYTRSASALEGLDGCFIVNTTLEMMPEDTQLHGRIESFMKRTLTLLTAAVIRGQSEGVFNSNLDERAVGDFLLCMIQGLRVFGKMVHEESRLTAIVDMSMTTIAKR
ncbi:TetR/AcrR family transcriptional regulator [Pseudomonas sp. FEN]|uniref:TetR/AcrR family transcriptional regulator n=1 Tax=Pseudomonas sp. FEN TaxID=2767468 RepID=UPI001CD2027F|nr:TetR/AcrR family transcriptional regulator [Pseudomonas sp. FEN]